MVIRERGQHRLILGGVPGGGMGVVFGLAVTLGIMGVGYTIMWTKGPAAGGPMPPVPSIALGVIGGVLLVGLTLRALERETLELDRTTGRGAYRRWSLLFGRGEQFGFDLAAVKAVELRRSVRTSPGGRGGRSMPRDVLAARVLVRSPRKAIELDETENFHDARVGALAAEVAGFLGCELARTGRGADDETGRRRTRGGRGGRTPNKQNDRS